MLDAWPQACHECVTRLPRFVFVVLTTRICLFARQAQIIDMVDRSQNTVSINDGFGILLCAKTRGIIRPYNLIYREIISIL